MNQLSIKRNVIYFSPVFRIHLILMWIQVICCRIFFKLIFMLKLYEPFRNQEIFIIYLFSIVQSRIRENKSFFCSFRLKFCPLDPDQHILRIWIQEDEILRIQRIWIQGTDIHYQMNVYTKFMMFDIFEQGENELPFAKGI